MPHTLEQERQKLQEKRDNEILAAVDFELIGAIAHAGGVLTGFSVKFGASDVLVTLRVILAGRQQVSFVGAPTLGDSLRKCVVDAYHDELRWKADAFAVDED